MAPPAGESRQRFGFQLAHSLAPAPGRLAFAARVALICALTALAAEVYQTPVAALSVYVVFFMNKPDRTGSLFIEMAFVFLVTLIIGFVTLVAMAVMDAPMWRVIAMTLISFAFLFL